MAKLRKNRKNLITQFNDSNLKIDKNSIKDELDKVTKEIEEVKKDLKNKRNKKSAY